MPNHVAQMLACDNTCMVTTSDWRRAARPAMLDDVLVDALLDFLPQQRADALILEPGKPPVISRAGQPMPLSMPGLDLQMIEDIIDEVTSELDRARLKETGELETKHRTRSDVEFTVSIRGLGASVRMLFRMAKATVKPAATPAAPVAVSTPAPGLPGAAAQASAPAASVVSVVAPTSRLSDAAPTTITDPALDSLLERAVLQGASDLFISPGVGAHVRIGQDLIELPDTGIDVDNLAHYFAPMWPRLEPELARTGSVDFAVIVGSGPQAARFRVNLFRQYTGLSAAFRPIRQTPPTLHSLGLDEELDSLTKFRTGLVLMTGQAGSGKSTTLVALLERLNRTSSRHIITIEDPIEYVYPRGRALIHQRELGVHVDSFGAGLRAALRESPDIILVGEMRDRETISAALTAAETGHLVLSTLHCGDAGSAVNRIVDVFPEHQQRQVREQLASSLRAVMTQMLLPGVRAPRVAAYELMRVNVPVAAKIREHRGHQLRSEIQKGRAEGMVPLELTVARLLRDRKVTDEVARAYVHDPRLLDEYLRQR
ncbi:type IV pilus twitching motility protein PilT [Enhygromyxa salina]|uniref:Twitching mobility protein n=1 Tax=Enhygromyxa salina TaxID=215803 RepID=A0A2S9YW98_9BACT|nr:PilT/PilU family type 4a pilus ATPase [Enhygromyxa salina]PRQ09360.1 Twitching mobility protein [Enhygromyxa salina]